MARIGRIINSDFFCVMTEYKILHKKMPPSTAAICAGLHKKSILYIISTHYFLQISIPRIAGISTKNHAN